MIPSTPITAQTGVADGVLIVNKEAGWTSHDVVAKVRGLLGGVKVGHAGTLDPAATGVLPLLIGRATRIAEYLVGWNKEYRAVLRLGETTDTQDGTGTVLQRVETSGVGPEVLRNTVARFVGPQKQIPPMYSAVKVAGRPLYKSARAGQTVERAERDIVIHALEVLAVDGRDITLRVVCSKGTYIRTRAAEEIVLGTAVSQTGKLAREGKWYVDGYAFAVDPVNKAGGVKVGGKPSKFALKMYDDQSDPNLSVRLYTRLVTSDKVNFLLGPDCSGITIPASSVAEKYQIPMIQGGGASGKIFDRGYKYIFGTLPKAEFYFQSAIEAAAKLNPPIKTAALLYSNEAFDRSVAEGSRLWLKEQKIENVYDEEYPRDYQRMLAAIARAEEQGLVGEEAIMVAFEENARDTSRVGGN